MEIINEVRGRFVKRGSEWLVRAVPGVDVGERPYVPVDKSNGDTTYVTLTTEVEPGIYRINEAPDECESCFRPSDRLRFMKDFSGISGWSCPDCAFSPEFA